MAGRSRTVKRRLHRIMGVVHGLPEGFLGVRTLEDNSLYFLYNISVPP